MLKFRLEISTTKEIIGYEYLTVCGWKNVVFDFGERDGCFDQRELGDGFLGVVNRQRFVTTDKDGIEMYEGDELKYKHLGGMHLNFRRLKYDENRCGFVLISDSTLPTEMPPKSGCSIFSIVL